MDKSPVHLPDQPSEAASNPTSAVRIQKAELRRHYLACRMSLSDEEYETGSSAIVEALKGLPEIRESTRVHCFWPLATKKEINLVPFVSWLQREEKQVVLPVMKPVETPEGPQFRLAHAGFTGDQTLHSNAWGVAEPIGGDSVPPATLHVVIVPALAVDKRGFRLGYGKGYYDLFLADLTIPKICPVFEGCLADALPAEPHDVPVDIIVTEDRILRVGKM